jgi:hypothetical protein
MLCSTKALISWAKLSQNRNHVIGLVSHCHRFSLIPPLNVSLKVAGIHGETLLNIGSHRHG